MKKLCLILCCLGLSSNAFAEEFTVDQKDKKFTEQEMNISVGDSVHFRNADPFSHNVYSLSESKSFDLGSYPKGESRTVVFDKAGVVEVGCAIHFDMAMKINVK